MSVSASLGEGGSGSAVEESKHGWALLNQGGNQGSLRTGFACEFGRLVGPRGSWESVSPSSSGGDAFSGGFPLEQYGLPLGGLVDEYS